MKPTVPTRQFTVESDRSLLVFDDLFDPQEVANFSTIIAQLNYERRDSFDNELNCNIANEPFKRAPFLYPVLEALLDSQSKRFGVSDPTVGLSHVYAAAVDSRTALLPHQDSQAPQAVSFLYYGNVAWRRDWGGETLFYDSAGEVVAGVIPKPGRLAMFHSNIAHRGGAPHPDAPTLRYTIASFFFPGCRIGHEVEAARAQVGS
ncbi:MAG: 2OG-Fe(II) oxygenase [Nannocystales bacterium]